MRGIWFIFGVTAIALGVIGIVLPLLPTVPFLLLAAFCFARSSDKAHRWLLEHPKLGKPIADWNETRAIAPKTKFVAIACIIASATIPWVLNLSVWVIAAQYSVLTLVTAFIWTRPNV